MLETPTIVTATAQPAAVIRLTIPRAEIQQRMGPAYQELFAAVGAQGAGVAGPSFSHHLRIDREVFDFLLGVPVASPVTAHGRVAPGELPGGRVARAVYVGGYEGLGAAWEEFDRWLAANGHPTDRTLWERYIAGPESGPDASAWRTELNRPLDA